MTIEQLKAKIALLEESIPKLETAWKQAGMFQVKRKTKWGRSMGDSEAFGNSVRRVAEAGKRYEDAKVQLVNFKARLRAMEAGEQPLSLTNLPAKEQRKNFAEQTAQYLSSQIHVGDVVYVMHDVQVTVKKVNKKSITVAHPHFCDSKYDYYQDNVRLPDGDKPMDDGKHIRLIREYFEVK